MNFKLIKPVNLHYSAIEQILTNRNIPYYDIHHWLNTTDADINDFNLLGADRLRKAAQTLIKTISQDARALVIVDSDCDGFTSSALLINYLYDHFPAWVQNSLDWFIHSGKQHGLSDVDVEWAAANYSLILCPDASSNDYEYHLAFIDKGVDIVVLDHHEAEIVSPNAIVVNNQLCDYPNKHLSGVGITWQFCRYLDSLLGTHYAENYLDLVALGNTADMMSLQSIETKHLIFKGFRPENVHNPFIATIAEKNAFSIGDKITPHGAAWYIAPFVNAMVRSGTEEEKELLFKSFLKFKAFDYIYSTKRGHKQGETEQLVTQAVRTCANVKTRQGKAQDDAMARLEGMIEDNSMMEHKVLLFLLEPGEVEPNVAGLVANKIMGKYQRPCAVLTKREREADATPTLVARKYFSYEGSARGCDKADVSDFKDICEATGLTQYVAGHQGAFGLGILPEDIDYFLEATDAALKNMPTEPVYYVDYIYQNTNVNSDQILEIAELGDIWGKDVDESYVAIDGLKITSEMVTVYRKKNNTLKITLPNKLSVMLFNAPDDLCEKLENTQGYVEMDIVGTANKNEYMGWVTPQIFIEEYAITGESRYNF
jgi:single-stranded-DNA-specific exonuclease